MKTPNQAAPTLHPSFNLLRGQLSRASAVLLSGVALAGFNGCGNSDPATSSVSGEDIPPALDHHHNWHYFDHPFYKEGPNDPDPKKNHSTGEVCDTNSPHKVELYTDNKRLETLLGNRGVKAQRIARYGLAREFQELLHDYPKIVPPGGMAKLVLRGEVSYSRGTGITKKEAKEDADKLAAVASDTLNIKIGNGPNQAFKANGKLRLGQVQVVVKCADNKMPADAAPVAPGLPQPKQKGGPTPPQQTIKPHVSPAPMDPNQSEPQPIPMPQWQSPNSPLYSVTI